MNSRTSSSLLLVVVLMICSAVCASAQTSGISDAKRRAMERLASGVRTQGVEPTTDERPSLGSVEDRKQASQSNNMDKKRALLGTWDLIITFSDGSVNKTTLTIIPGRSDTEGTVIHSADASFVPPFSTLPQQGVWQYLGGGKFVVSDLGFSFDETLQPDGRVGFRQLIKVSDDQESFTGTGQFVILDTTGQMFYSDSVQSTGTRQHPVAP